MQSYSHLAGPVWSQTSLTCWLANFKSSHGHTSEITSYWVWIVAGGCRQVKGVNYSEMFSVAQMPTVKVALTNTAIQDWEIEHIDIKSAYLNVTLKEMIYMKLPWGILKPGEEGKVCHLVKGLYKLKQAGCGWYQEMSQALVKDLRFTHSTVDHLVFFQHLPNEHMIIAVTMDDMAVTSKQAKDITRFKAEIQHYWEITDNGPICLFLGFQILIKVCTSKPWLTSSGWPILHPWQPQWSLAQHSQLLSCHWLQHKQHTCVEYCMWKQSVASFGQL